MRADKQEQPAKTRLTHERQFLSSRVNHYFVPGTGLAPARPCGHYHLKVACILISTPGHLQLLAYYTQHSPHVQHARSAYVQKSQKPRRSEYRRSGG